MRSSAGADPCLYVSYRFLKLFLRLSLIDSTYLAKWLSIVPVTCLISNTFPYETCYCVCHALMFDSFTLYVHGGSRTTVHLAQSPCGER